MALCKGNPPVTSRDSPRKRGNNSESVYHGMVSSRDHCMSLEQSLFPWNTHMIFLCFLLWPYHEFPVDCDLFAYILQGCITCTAGTWRHGMETLSALLALCEGNPPVTGGFPPQRPRNAAVKFSLMLALANCWINRRIDGDLRRHEAHVTSP